MLLPITINAPLSGDRQATSISTVEGMAASVIRNLSGFGLARPVRTCLILAEDDDAEDEYEEELREETEADFDEEGSPATGSPQEEQWGADTSFGTTEAAERLLRFAELISGDVQRYFGRGQDPDACDVYDTDGEGPEVGSSRRRYYTDFIRAAAAEQGKEPEKLGPLAELFQETHRKKQGLPMNQRRLPSSFWNEPHPHHLAVSGDANTPDMLGCTTETGLSNSNASVRMLSTSCTPVSTLISSAAPDFSDLLAHWASDRDNPIVFSCDYQLP